VRVQALCCIWRGLRSGVRQPTISMETGAATPPPRWQEDRGGGQSLVLHLEGAWLRCAVN